MDRTNDSPSTPKGRFLWMDADSRVRYLADLRQRISDGFFASEVMADTLVEELAPVFGECLDQSRR